jgi:hypothetical protein
MKPKLGVLVILLLTSIILGAAQPARLYACQTPDGSTPWDQFVNKNSFKGGTPIQGTLTVIYSPLSLGNFFPGTCSTSQAIMFYSVRLIYDKKPYTYEGNTTVCLGDFGTPGTGGQGDVIQAFLDFNLRWYFPYQANLPVNQWYIKSLKNAGIGQFSFVGDIVVYVK